MITIFLLSVLTSFVIWGFLALNKRRQYFKERGIKHMEPGLILGNTAEMIFGKKHQCETVDDIYKAFPEEELLGFFSIGQPQLIARTPELINMILVQNFSNFSDRVSDGNRDGKFKNPFEANLFAMNGHAWRIARNRFSPLFTSGKLKYMYHAISDCGNNLANVLDKKNDEEIDVSDVMALFSMDVIGSTAFGLDANVLENPNTMFRQMGKKVFDGSISGTIRTSITFAFPKFARFLGIQGFFANDVGDYFVQVLRNTMEERKEKGLERNDFIQMVLQLKERGKIEIQVHDSADDYLKIDETTPSTFELEMSDNLLLGGAFTFIIAGFHAAAMTLAFGLYELARHPEVVKKLRAEIKETLRGEEPTYDELKNMPYLEKVINETSRLYPTAPLLGRTCTKEFTTPGGTVIKVGQQMLIPVYSVQRDPAYWNEPEVFNPDRWDPENPPKPGTYIPFGDGPRICIAMRFAILELKYAMVKLIKNYNFEVTKRTEIPVKIHPRAFLMTPKGGLYLRVTKAN